MAGNKQNPRYETIKVDGIYVGVPRGQTKEEREASIAAARDTIANDPEFNAMLERSRASAAKFEARRQANREKYEREQYEKLKAKFEAGNNSAK